MPGSILGELILRPIFELVFHVVAYCIGSVVVPIVSLGRWKCDPMLRETSKKKQHKVRWGGLYQVRGQQVYVKAEGTALVGLVFGALVVAAVIWWRFQE
jgi:hypothetical protein